MLRILIADGTPATMQAERETFGIPSNASLFEAALRSHQPHIGCSSINVADGRDLPAGVSLEDFDGLMFSGSPLHIYDRTPEVTRQIDFARAAFTAGVPTWGSCWGLQVATVALGGTVRRNPRGRELGVARAIATTAAGRSHPLLAARPSIFDALCEGARQMQLDRACRPRAHTGLRDAGLARHRSATPSRQSDGRRHCPLSYIVRNCGALMF
jgi:GMP synthase (glutamine-hydrolysing)